MRLCLRFNPDVCDGDNVKTMTGGDLTKFGILLEAVEEVKQIVRRGNLKVVGLHEHTGSGLQRCESVYRSMENLMAIAVPENFPDLEFLDFGGGFKVPYKPDEARIDYVAMGAEIARLFEAFTRRYGRRLNMLFEPGKYIFAEAGVLRLRFSAADPARALRRLSPGAEPQQSGREAADLRRLRQYLRNRRPLCRAARAAGDP